MAVWLDFTIGGVEESIALVMVVYIYLFVKIFGHETTNFYSRISALLLCAGATLSICRLGIDGYLRFVGFSWIDPTDPKEKLQRELATTVFVYNPVLVYAIPVFAVVCDWTEGLTLLRSGEQINPERFF